MALTEYDILNLFYDELKALGTNRENLYLNMDEYAAAKLQLKLKQVVSLQQVHTLVDVCIANEWIQRTTADPGYNFLSLTYAGLQVALANRYAE